jgi:hypothetical protein
VGVVINELEVVAAPPPPPATQQAAPGGSVSPVDIEMILRRAGERRDRVRAS